MAGELSRLYIPAESWWTPYGNGLAEVVASDILANGPVHELIVPDTPDWREVRETDYGPFVIRILDGDIERSMRSAASHFLEEIEGSLRALADEDAEKLTSDLRTFLVAMQVGCRYQCAIAVPNLLKNAIRSSNALAFLARGHATPETIDRLAATHELAHAYGSGRREVAGLLRSTKVSRKKAIELLDDSLVESLGRSKWALGQVHSPLRTRLARVKRSARDVLGSKLADSFGLGYGSVNLLSGGAASVPAVDGALLIGQYLKSVDVETYAPALVDPTKMVFMRPFTKQLIRSQSRIQTSLRKW